MFTELDSMAGHHLQDVADSEYLRMISWLRRTCALLTQPATTRSVAAEGAGTASQPRAARWGLLAEAENQDMQARLKRQGLELLNPTP